LSNRATEVASSAVSARNYVEVPLSLASPAGPTNNSTVITKHGRAVAARAPIAVYNSADRQRPLTPLAGSGTGLWGPESGATIAELRDEWSR
jgi:hypothetical protein